MVKETENIHSSVMESIVPNMLNLLCEVLILKNDNSSILPMKHRRMSLKQILTIVMIVKKMLLIAGRMPKFKKRPWKIPPTKVENINDIFYNLNDIVVYYPDIFFINV